MSAAPAVVGPAPAEFDPAHTVRLWLPPQDWHRLVHAALDEGVSVTDIVRRLVHRGLEGGAS